MIKYLDDAGIKYLVEKLDERYINQINKKADDYSIEMYNGTSGNPKPVKFISVDYSACGSENGVAIKLGMVSGHGNGSSYAFLQDVIIKVTHVGTIEVDNFKYYGASTGTYEGANRQYGDIFWVHNADTKIVDFYVLMGQYARVQMTPWKRVTYSTGGSITQYNSATVYSEGTKEWGNNSEFALVSDLSDYLKKDDASNTYITKDKLVGSAIMIEEDEHVSGDFFATNQRLDAVLQNLDDSLGTMAEKLDNVPDDINDKLSNCVNTSDNQTISGNKVFIGTTSTMTLHTYNPLYINNGTDNSKNTSLYTDTDGVFKIVNSSSSVKRPTYNGKGMALTDDLSSYLPLTGGTVSGNLSVSGKIMQGATSSDATVANMNRYQSDLYVQGDGSAPNNPRVAGFYIGKSQSDDNRHMDIVSGGDYSYIDFNQAGHETDYDARLLVNVSTGDTQWMWGPGMTTPVLNVMGYLRKNGVEVATVNDLTAKQDKCINNNNLYVGDDYLIGLNGSTIEVGNLDRNLVLETLGDRPQWTDDGETFKDLATTEDIENLRNQINNSDSKLELKSEIQRIGEYRYLIISIPYSDELLNEINNGKVNLELYKQSNKKVNNRDTGRNAYNKWVCPLKDFGAGSSFFGDSFDNLDTNFSVNVDMDTIPPSITLGEESNLLEITHTATYIKLTYNLSKLALAMTYCRVNNTINFADWEGGKYMDTIIFGNQVVGRRMPFSDNVGGRVALRYKFRLFFETTQRYSEFTDTITILYTKGCTGPYMDVGMQIK